MKILNNSSVNIGGADTSLGSIPGLALDYQLGLGIYESIILTSYLHLRYLQLGKQEIQLGIYFIG